MISSSTTPVFLSSPHRSSTLPLLILMPGMDGTGYLWRSQLPQLEANFDVCRLSIPAHNLATWKELSSQVIHLIKQEILGDREVYLCGESFGSCLALEVATHLPNIYHRLILINPASAFSQLPLLGLAEQACRLLPNPLYYLTTWAALPFLAALERITSENRVNLLQAVQSVPKNTVAWRLGMLRDFQINPDQLQQLKQPVLILVGGSDRILPSLRESDRLRQYLPQTKVLVLPNSGHACMLETGISLNAILQEWM